MYRFFSLFLVLFSLGACAQNEGNTAQSDLSVSEVSELLSTNKDLVVLDVRTPDEYQEGHLEGAQLINFYDADFEERIAALDKEAEYIVYCRSGGRSSKAASKMKELGFGKFHNMKGGILAWNRAGLAVSK